MFQSWILLEFSQPHADMSNQSREIVVCEAEIQLLHLQTEMQKNALHYLKIAHLSSKVILIII